MSFVVKRVMAFSEVFMVAFLGSFLTQIGFSFWGISSDQILQNSQLLFVFFISEGSLTILLIAFFLWTRGEAFRKIGWDWTHVFREAGIGVGSVPVLFGATLLVGTFFYLVLPGYVSTTNPMLEMVKSRIDLLLFLISSILVGGLKEEIQRAFILVRFEDHLGGILVGLGVWSVVFGFEHQLQGVDKAAGAGVLGLLFGLIFVWRRKLAAPIVSHALYDVVTVTLFWKFVERV